MTVYRLTPAQGVPVLRCAGNIHRATARGLQEFPAGLLSVEPVGVPELAALAAEGWPLPVAARQRVEVYKAVQREKVKAAAKVEAIRDKAREAARAKREEEASELTARKAQEKADRSAERKRNVAAQRCAARRAQKAERLKQPGASVVVDTSDTRLPWED